MTQTQKLDKNLQSQWTVKTRWRTSTVGSFELLSSWCIHDRSYYSFWENDLNAETQHKLAAVNADDDNNTRKAIHMSGFCFTGMIKLKQTQHLNIRQNNINKSQQNQLCIRFLGIWTIAKLQIRCGFDNNPVTIFLFFSEFRSWDPSLEWSCQGYSTEMVTIYVFIEYIFSYFF